ncbi:hypothetical protein HOF17_02370, partial [Candidatus Peribacteria bacterium]|nr:hypothetical protein [Candidatus Peribacteria bacterium]
MMQAEAQIGNNEFSADELNEFSADDAMCHLADLNAAELINLRVSLKGSATVMLKQNSDAPQAIADFSRSEIISTNHIAHLHN